MYLLYNMGNNILFGIKGDRKNLGKKDAKIQRSYFHIVLMFQKKRQVFTYVDYNLIGKILCPK